MTTAEGIPKSNAPAPDEAQELSQPIVEGAEHTIDTSPIDDPLKARVMAEAGKEQRDKAAGSRNKAAKLRNEARSSRYPGNFDPAIHGEESRARSYDKQAETIEEWAAILHDHPVSEDFKKKYPGVEFNPAGLATAEARLKNNISENEFIEEALKDLIPGEVLTGDREGVVVPLFTIADKETDPERKEAIENEWERLLNDPKSTLGQIKDFYLENYRKYIHGPNKEDADEGVAVFNKIRNGQTGE